MAVPRIHAFHSPQSSSDAARDGDAYTGIPAAELGSDHLPHGLVFAGMMVCVMIGSNVFGTLMSAGRFLLLALLAPLSAPSLSSFPTFPSFPFSRSIEQGSSQRASCALSLQRLLPRWPFSTPSRRATSLTWPHVASLVSWGRQRRGRRGEGGKANSTPSPF